MPVAAPARPMVDIGVRGKVLCQPEHPAPSAALL